MKVLKFGGTSVGTPESIQLVRQIVESRHEPTIVVVSALSGVTDQLIHTAQLAAEGDTLFREEVAQLRIRHEKMVKSVVASSLQSELLEKMEHLFYELSSILQGVFLIQELTPKSSDAIVAYGERLSSLLCTSLINNAKYFDSTALIKTCRQDSKHIVDFEQTNRLVAQAFADFQGIAVVGGFISSDADTGYVTNLGRGGSDYTASIIAAALNAELLEIWTDVDGFMTADPRVIQSAYTIEELSYEEASELCNFGAKVVYPPTIFPARSKNIPIYIKNTFRPEAKGSVIHRNAKPSSSFIRGISSINETSMVTVSGMAMVGVIGVNRRIFGSLTNAGISVFMVSQTSSEASTTLCIAPEDAKRACQVLDAEFEAEIISGAMYPAILQEGMATIACVGENMRHVPGVMGKLFSTLGRNGINVYTSAQGALEMNLSLVVDRSQLRKSLSVLHDCFFLSAYQEINVFLCGIGTVGGSLLQQICSQQEQLKKEHALKVNVVGIANSRQSVFNPEGIDLTKYESLLAESHEGGVQKLKEAALKFNLYNSVFVDCTARHDAVSDYEELLSHNISVVAANKSAAASDYADYSRLKHIARDRGVKYLFETNVGAGLPVINTINDLRSSGDRILKIEAVLSGTLNFVFNVLSADVPMSRAVAMAKEQGYSEPDPRIDLSGGDVVRKITILARESGYRVNTEDIEARTFLPKALFDGDLDSFWKRLPELDSDFETRRQRLESERKRWRFVARWCDGKGSVGLEEISQGHPFYGIEGSNNIVLLTTERYHDYPMIIQGYGAGAAVTAAGVFADIMRVANV